MGAMGPPRQSQALAVESGLARLRFEKADRLCPAKAVKYFRSRGGFE